MRELERPIKILMGENGDDLFKLYVYLNNPISMSQPTTILSLLPMDSEMWKLDLFHLKLLLDCALFMT